MSAAALHPFLVFLERLALMVDGLGECIAGRREWNRLDEPLFASALKRVQRLFASVQRAVLLAATGRVRPRPRHPLPPAGSCERRRKPLLPGEVKLPGGMGWLGRLVPGSTVYGFTLTDLLADPALPAMLADAPTARRSLRALCIMLGADVPAFLRPPARPSKADAAAASSAPAEARDAQDDPAAATGGGSARTAGDGGSGSGESGSGESWAERRSRLSVYLSALRR